MNSKPITLYTTTNSGKKIPISGLDNVLVPSKTKVKVAFHDFFNGKEITVPNKRDFYEQLEKQIKEEKYLTTDHLFICVEVNGIIVLYVSLDNSNRANSCGHPLKNRLISLCIVVKNFITECGGKCVIFFSESCRMSFDGSFGNETNKVGWFSMRQVIEKKCDLKYLGECSNNEDSNDMSFGVSAFCTENFLGEIYGVLPRRILTEGFGSGSVGIKLTNGQIIWGIHFPLDFKNKGSSNLGAKAMGNLCTLMTQYKGSVCALGDFNTIPGDITNSIRSAITPEYHFVVENELTFFGSYFDTVEPRDGETWERFEY